MSCYYLYMGRKFDTVEKLNDFLMESENFKKYGDLVFSTPVPVHIYNTVAAKGAAGQRLVELKKISRNVDNYNDITEEELNFVKPFIGVTTAIQMAINPFSEDGTKSAFPQLIRDNYFNNLFLRANVGDYSFINEEDLKNMFGTDTPEPITNKDEFNKVVREYLEEKWKFQANYGNAIHDAMQCYMSGIAKDVDGVKKPLRKISDRNVRKEAFKNSILNGFYTEAKFSGDGNVILNGQSVSKTDMLSDADMDYLFDYAEKMYMNIRRRFGTYDRYDRNGNIVEYGAENFEIYSELMVYDDSDVRLYNMEDDEYMERKISGAIDLMVVDNTGTPHFIDYKTSPKSYYGTGKNGWDETKRNLYALQLSIYKNIMARAGMPTINSQLFLAPMQLGRIHKNDEGRFVCDGLIKNPSRLDGDLVDITSVAQSDKISYVANSMLNAPIVTTPDERDFITKTNELIKSIMPTHNYYNEEISEERLQKIMEDRVALDKDTGYYKFYTSKSKKRLVRVNGEAIMAKNLDSIRNMVEKYMNNKPVQRTEKTANIYNRLKHFSASGSDWTDVLYESSTYDSGTTNASINEFFRKYNNGNWTIIDNEATKKAISYGVIFMKNIETGQVDVINITNEDPDELNPMSDKDGKSLIHRELLSGAFYDDIKEKSKKSLMLTSTNGNIELMRSMAVLYNLKDMFGENAKIGNFHVIGMNGGSTYADNKQIKYTFKTLARNAGLKISGGPKMMDPLSKAKAAINDIKSLAAKDNIANVKKFGYLYSESEAIRKLAFLDNENESNTIITALDKAENDADVLNALVNIKTQLELAYSELRYKPGEKMNIYGEHKEVVELYRNISDAILNYSNIELRQQNEASDKWAQFSIRNILKKGYTSLEFDNPGMLYNELLNDVTRYADNCYQNVRDGMQNPLNNVISLEEKMVKSIGSNNTMMLFKNREDMWSSLLEKNPDGSINEELVFKHIDDPSLNNMQKDVLKGLLTEINRYRYRRSGSKLLTDEEVWKYENDEKFYWAPIVKRVGPLNTEVDQAPAAKNVSMLGSLKRGVSSLLRIKEFKNYVEESVLYEEQEEKNKRNIDSIFELHNVGKHENSQANRMKYINNLGPQNIDLNMANSVLQYIFNEQMSEHLDKAIIVAKCATTHLMTEGKLMSKNFESDIQYLVDYVRNKINKQDINDKSLKWLGEIMDKVSNIAVKATLGFSPVQLGYQGIQGVFTNSSILFRKVLGEKNSFTSKDFSEACKIVYSDIVKDSSVISLINRLYSINDTDMSDYVRKANDRNDLYSFNGIAKLGMVFASRPDYYNRMTLFVSQMIHDGTFYAYSKVNGKLVYDFDKDQRFNLLRKQGVDKNSEEYQKQLGLYIATAKQMMIEGIYNEDGTKFEYKAGDEIIPLPKAYTNQQSEAYKNIADDAYGYYNNEKKAMIHALLIGKAFMQFKTYFSGKKNQYFMPGGVKVKGSYEHAEMTVLDENGNQVVEKLFSYIDEDGMQRIARRHIDENGNETFIDDEAPEGYSIIQKEKCIPFYAWKGRYQEGIMLTLAKLFALRTDLGSWSAAYDYYANNEDETVRAAFNQNMKQLFTDISTAIIVGGFISKFLMGGLVDDMEKDKEIDSIAKDCAYIIMRCFANSSLDANMFSFIGSFFGTWTPMSITWTMDVTKDLGMFMTGNKSATSVFTDNISVLRQFKNTFNGIFDDEKD